MRVLWIRGLYLEWDQKKKNVGVGILYFLVSGIRLCINNTIYCIWHLFTAFIHTSSVTVLSCSRSQCFK